MDESTKLTSVTEWVNGVDDGGVCNLFDQFIFQIETTLKSAKEGSLFYYLSNDRFMVPVFLDNILEFDDLRPEYNEEVFMEELPNIIKLYESVGWEVKFEEKGEEDAKLVFTGELSKSKYRSILATLK